MLTVNKYKASTVAFVLTTGIFAWLWLTTPPNVVLQTHTEYKTVEVVKEVPVEIIKEVTKEVQVPFEVIKEVVREVPVEVTVVKEVQVPAVCPVIEQPKPVEKTKKKPSGHKPQGKRKTCG